MKLTRLRLPAILVTSGLLLVLWSVSYQSTWMEQAYAARIYPWIITILMAITGWVPFSLAEAVMGLALLGVVCYAGWRMLQFWRGREPRIRVILRLAGDSLLFALIVTLFGYLLWGLNYSRPALAARLGWLPQPRAAPALAPNLGALALEVVELTNQTYVRCCAEAVFVPSRPSLPLAQLDLHLNRGLVRAARQLGLRTPLLGSTRAKPLAASLVMNYLGLAGFYFPWTGEANFNRQMPLLEGIHAMAHEKAHQLGFAREDEANFIGFLSCIQSEMDFARYSGYFFANRQLLGLLRRVDRDAWREAAALLDPGIARDQSAISDYWKRFEGPSQEVARTVNNAHLRLNRVPGGILSYGRSVELILQLAAHNGNSLAF